MTPFTALLLLLAATTFLSLLPFVPAILELHRKTDAAPLDIIRDHDGDIRRFAAGLRRYLQEQGMRDSPGMREEAGMRDEREVRHPSSLIPHPSSLIPAFEGVFADGTPFLLIEAAPDGAEIPYALSDPPAQRMIVAYRPLLLPARTLFRMDLFATGAIHGGEESVYRAVLSDREILLARGSTVFRWIHSEDQLLVEPDSLLYGRASAERLVRLGSGCQFERLHAARIEFGVPAFRRSGVPAFGSDGSPEHGHPQCPDAPAAGPAALPAGARVLDQAGRRTLVRGDLVLPAGQRFAGDLVVTGRLLVGEDAAIDGSVKSYKEMVLARGARVQGSMVSGRSIAVGPACQVGGPVIAEREITIEAGAQLGTADRPTTVCAPHLRIHPGVVAFGTVRAHRLGQVVEAGGWPGAGEAPAAGAKQQPASRISATTTG